MLEMKLLTLNQTEGCCQIILSKTKCMLWRRGVKERSIGYFICTYHWVNSYCCLQHNRWVFLATAHKTFLKVFTQELRKHQCFKHAIIIVPHTVRSTSHVMLFSFHGPCGAMSQTERNKNKCIATVPSNYGHHRNCGNHRDNIWRNRFSME